MPGRVKKRSYVSPSRQVKAEATRARIIDAAAALFLEVGYRRTSTAAIGKAAQTSEASVFAVFGSKADLLVAVVRDHVVRDSDFPLRQQPVWRALSAQPDKTPAIEAAARVVRRAHDRSWRLLAVAAAAAQDDLVVAEAVGPRGPEPSRRLRVVRAGGHRHRRAGRDPRIDEVWTLISVENYRHLVVERSWSPVRYESWLAAMLTAALR